jgi:tetratricopeptide (TPR) repeat protein
MHNLARAYLENGQLDKAVPLHEQTLEKHKAKLAPDHPHTLNSMNSLAAAYLRAGKLDRSVPLFEETLRLRKAKLGPEHPRTLKTAASLAAAYDRAGEFAKAEPLYRGAADGAKKNHAGKPHWRPLESKQTSSGEHPTTRDFPSRGRNPPVRFAGVEKNGWAPTIRAGRARWPSWA